MVHFEASNPRDFPHAELMFVVAEGASLLAHVAITRIGTRGEIASKVTWILHSSHRIFQDIDRKAAAAAAMAD